jgi:CheY-like chemotaxis protein
LSSPALAATSGARRRNPGQQIKPTVSDGHEPAHADRLLAADGFDVVATGSAQEALTRLRASLACCLVVFDWRMPGMDGEQFHQALSADPRLAAIPLLVLTGDAQGRQAASKGGRS